MVGDRGAWSTPPWASSRSRKPIQSRPAASRPGFTRRMSGRPSLTEQSMPPAAASTIGRRRSPVERRSASSMGLRSPLAARTLWATGRAGVSCASRRQGSAACAAEVRQPRGRTNHEALHAPGVDDEPPGAPVHRGERHRRRRAGGRPDDRRALQGARSPRSIRTGWCRCSRTATCASRRARRSSSTSPTRSTRRHIRRT